MRTPDDAPASPKRWAPGERAVFRSRHRGRDILNPRTVAEIDKPNLLPGVQLVFDRPDPHTGATECYATHYDLEPEPAPAGTASPSPSPAAEPDRNTAIDTRTPPESITPAGPAAGGRAGPAGRAVTRERSG